MMRAMILPFEDAELNILKACDFDGDTSMFEGILKAVYGGNVPDVFGKTNIRDDIIRAEHVRIIRRFRQRNYGKAEEKEDRMRTKTNLVRIAMISKRWRRSGVSCPSTRSYLRYAQ